jgi:hypothetical protein
MPYTPVYEPPRRPYTAQIFWKPSVADPAHQLWFTADGAEFGSRWLDRILINLLGWRIEKRWEEIVNVNGKTRRSCLFV